VDLVTGRRHQIRVHLCALGHPVLGDPLYGRGRPVGGSRRLMLHALELVLPAPFGLVLRAEPPEDFRRELDARRAR
jgi:tRNA pseudouridine32 synthase/23S rRNA pseudouridine746 synthase